MKIKKKYPVVFIAAFLVGSAAFLLITLVSQSKNDSLEIPKEVVTNEVPNQPVEEMWKLETVRESDQLSYDPKRPFKIRLLETGDLEGDIRDGKSGEIWLGLFKENNDYFLRPTKLKVRPLYEELNYKQENIGKIVTVTGNKRAIFLLKNANFLKEGKIQTLFKGMDYGEIYELNQREFNPAHKVTELTTDSPQIYEIGGKRYELKVVRAFNKEGYYMNAFVLEGNGKRQVLHAALDALILWVGDLDRDNKPDVFLQVSESDYFADRILFLSSQAEKGKLVKKVACISFSDSC